MSSWKDHARRVTPYVPGEQPRKKQMIKLNTNENPYPPSPKVAQALSAMDRDAFRRYPDPEASELVQALSETYQVPESCIFAGVGSDDVLATAFLTFFTEFEGEQAERKLLFPDITYSFYQVWADLYRIPYQTIPLNEAFRIPIDQWCKEAPGQMEGKHAEGKYAEGKYAEGKHVQAQGIAAGEPTGVGRPRGIVIANPNAPTGIAEPLSEMEKIIRANPDCVVIVDEAYVDFGGESVLPLIKQYDNLLVVQTFSKSRSMAGMRIGFAFGAKALIDSMKAVKYSINSYTLNLPSIQLGKATISDEAYFKECCEKIIRTREETAQVLQEEGFCVLPSRTNFLFAKPTGISAGRLYEKLREKNIFVRYFDAPRIRDYLRITIGTKEEMAVFLQTVKEIIRENRKEEE